MTEFYVSYAVVRHSTRREQIHAQVLRFRPKSVTVYKQPQKIEQQITTSVVGVYSVLIFVG